MKWSVVDLLVRLVNIPSLSEGELVLCQFVYQLLGKFSFDQLEKQIVDRQGFNIIAQCGQPSIVLQAHLDTVPPFIKASKREGKIFGRGACDTKSSLAAMIMAVQKAQEQKLTNFALIFTVGEETNFRGAKNWLKIIHKICLLWLLENQLI